MRHFVSLTPFANILQHLYENMTKMIFRIVIAVILTHVVERTHSKASGRDSPCKKSVEKLYRKEYNHIREVNINPITIADVTKPFTHSNCLFNIRNFWRINLPETTNPVVVQAMSPWEIVNDKVVWTVKNLDPKKHCIIKASLNLTSCMSRFTFRPVRGNIIERMCWCGTINLTKWVFEIRPWNCEVLLDVFTPKFSKEFTHPYMSLHIRTVPVYHFPHIPSKMPQIHLIMKAADFTGRNTKQQENGYVKDVLKREYMNHPYIKAYNVLFFITECTINSKSKDVDCSQLKYTTIDNSDSTMSPVFRNKEVEVTKLLNYKRHMDRETLWQIPGLSEEEFVTVLHECKNPFTAGASSIANIMASISNVETRTNIVYAHLLHLSMGNFSYLIRKTRACKYPGIEVESNPNENSKGDLVRTWYPYRLNGSQLPLGSLVSFNNSLLSLTFVACGNSEIFEIEFSSLFYVFDVNVWTCICVMILLVWLIFRHLAKDGQLSTVYIMTSWKVLFEQGDTLPARLESFPSIRCMLGGLIIAGIVLSNTYKSATVYRMTRDRSRNAYDTLEKLHSHNFTVYSRVGAVEFRGYADDIPDGKIQDQMWHVDDTGQSSQHMHAEGARIFSAYSELSASKYTSPRSKDVLLASEISRLHPDSVWEILKPIKKALTDNTSSGMLEDKEIVKLYKTAEEDLLINGIKSCSNTAIILPEVVAARYKQILQNIPVTSPVDIGVRRILTVLTAVNFEGFISASELLRIRILHESGISSWWEMHTKASSDLVKNEDEEVSPAKISGNIIIIFIIYLGGNLLASLVIVCEVVVCLV